MKEEFYCCADALIGIYCEVKAERNISQTLLILCMQWGTLVTHIYAYAMRKATVNHPDASMFTTTQGQINLSIGFRSHLSTYIVPFRKCRNGR